MRNCGPRTTDQGQGTNYEEKSSRSLVPGLWSLVLFLLLVPGLWSLVPGPAVSAPPITEIQIEGDIPDSKDQILSLLPFKKGDPFDSQKLNQGLQYLRSWGIFKTVEAKTKETAGGTLIQLHLEGGEIIGMIHIAGHYPYLEAKIRKRLNLQVGDVLTLEKIEEQKLRILRFYERKGFYDTRVDVKTNPEPRENHVQLVFHIHKGKRLRVGRILFEGNHNIPTGRLYSFIGPMDLFSERRLKNTLADLVQFYREEGYLKVKARVADSQIDWKKNRAYLKVAVDEGPRVKIFFKGRRHYRLKTLKEMITLFKNGNFDSVELKVSANAIKKNLTQEGFQGAKVTFKKEKIRPDLYYVTFHISPGVQTFIQKIVFEGDKSISERKIKKYLYNKEHRLAVKGVLNKEMLPEDQKIAKEIYESRGFPFVSISKPEVTLSADKMRYRVFFRVEEGPLVKVKEIGFEGAEPFPKKALLKVIKNEEGKFFNKAVLLNDEAQVERFFRNNGYPYVQIRQETQNVSEKETAIFYHIQKGPRVVIGDILFVGDILTGVRPLNQALGIRSGEPYSEQKILQAELNLRRLGTFNAVSVKPIGLEEKEEVIHLLVKVEERLPFVADLQTQFSTDQQYSGTFQFTNYNSFGWAKQTRLALTGGLKKDRVELSWLDPRFLGADLQMSFGLWLDYKKRSIDTTAQTGGAVSFFRLFRRFGFLGKYQLSRDFVVEGESADPNSLRDSTLSEIGLSGSYDRRDNYADPTKGFFTLVGGTIFNEIKGARADFAKLKTTYAHYLSPFKFLTFSTTLRVDRIQDLIKAASIPQRELFGLGGDDTVRGFREDRAGPLDAKGNLLGGRTRLIFNEEAHIRLVKDFQLAAFYDGGTLTDGFNDIDLQTYRHSFGAGLRYITPVGPIRADYGIIIDRKPGENFGRFHFTFGYLF